MLSHIPSQRILAPILLTVMFFLTAQTYSFAAKKDKQKEYVMTEIELQSELMSYADRFASIMAQSFEDFDALKPSPEARRLFWMTWFIPFLQSLPPQPSQILRLLCWIWLRLRPWGG